MLCPFCKEILQDDIPFCVQCGQVPSLDRNISNAKLQSFWEIFRREEYSDYPQYLKIIEKFLHREQLKRRIRLISIAALCFIVLVASIWGIHVKDSKPPEETFSTAEGDVSNDAEDNRMPHEALDFGMSTEEYVAPEVTDGFEYESPLSEEPENFVTEQAQYILWDSDTRYVNRAELIGFTAEECRLARNELYARHGRKFQDEGLQAYFNSCDWYSPVIEAEDFQESVLNAYEIANRDLIVAYEKEMGYR